MAKSNSERKSLLAARGPFCCCSRSLLWANQPHTRLQWWACGNSAKKRLHCHAPGPLPPPSLVNVCLAAPSAPSLTLQLFLLQSLRESRLRKAAELAQRAPLAVLELDEQHRHYDRLIMAAERALFASPPATQPPPPSTPDSVAADPGVEPEWQDKQQVGAAAVPGLQAAQAEEKLPAPTGAPRLSHPSSDQAGKAPPERAAEVAMRAGGQPGERGPTAGGSEPAGEASAGAHHGGHVDRRWACREWWRQRDHGTSRWREGPRQSQLADQS